MDSAEAHKVADSLRKSAETAPPIGPKQTQWREGFCDGLRFAAAVVDLAADGKLVRDAEGAAFEALMAPLRRAAE